MKHILLLTLLLFTGCAVMENTMNPPVSPEAAAAQQVLQMHQAIISMQQAAPAESLSAWFKINWGTPKTPTDGYRVYRKAPTDQNFQLLGTTTDTMYTDKTPAMGIRYRYCIRAYKGTFESVCTLSVSGAWVALGDPGIKKMSSVYYDTLWTHQDMLIVHHPDHQPCAIEWKKDGGERVIWRGYFDVDGNGYVDLSDLAYYSFHYQKIARDSLGIR